MYGVHNVAFQHRHILSTESSYLGDLRAGLDTVPSRMSNVTLEFGTSPLSADDPADRQKAIDLTKQRIDSAPVLGTPRVMINQGALTEERQAWALPALKQMVADGESKGIRLSSVLCRADDPERSKLRSCPTNPVSSLRTNWRWNGCERRMRKTVSSSAR